MKDQRVTEIAKPAGRVNFTIMALGSGLLALFYLALYVMRTSSNIIWIITIALAQGIIYLVAVWVIWRAPAASSTLLLVIILAALLRGSLLFMPPALSSDIYRYIWDGRVQAAGINPYRYIPSEAPLAGLRDTVIYPNINRFDYAHTIYPPVAQMIFLAVSRISESPIWMKAAMVGFEGLTLWALAGLLTSFGRPRQHLLIFAWHPLLIWEIAGSGHIDAALIAFVVLALYARRRHQDAVTGVALACAVLVKFIPVALFPALYRRNNWKMPIAFAATILLAYLPYLSVGAGVFGYLPGYVQEEGLESGQRFFLLSLARYALPGAGLSRSVYFIFAAAVLLALACRAFFKRARADGDYLGHALFIAAVLTVLLSPHYAWYLTWLIPFLCFVPAASIFYLTAASFLLYGLWLGETADRLLMINALLYGPLVILSGRDIWQALFGARHLSQSSEMTGNELI